MGESIDHDDAFTGIPSKASELWRHADPASTPMWRFLRTVNHKHNLHLTGYPDLYKWSVDNVAQFWDEVWQFVGIVSSQPYTQVRCLSRCRLIELDLHVRSGPAA